MRFKFRYFLNAHPRQLGFTLAEVLIALAILGVIAAYTIPNVITSSNNEGFNSKAKEAMGMISDAYLRYKQANGG